MKVITQLDGITYAATLKGVWKIEIIQDTECDSPRECDNLGSIVTFGRANFYSDKNQKGIWDDWEEFIERHNPKEFVILPVYKYEHGQVSLNTEGFNCRWDSGQIGFIYCSKEVAVNEFGKKYFTKKVKEKTLNCLKAEVETYSSWLQGNCYGYQVSFATWDYLFEGVDNPTTYDERLAIVTTWDETEWDSVEFIETDSCWGYIETEHQYEKMDCYNEAINRIQE